MRAAARRRQLLDAAAQITGRGGLDRLTMVGTATEAGVSRQLVYEHFADLPTLVWALVADRFGAADATIAAALAQPREDRMEVALLATRLLLSLPSEQRHLVRSLVNHANLEGHELSVPAARLRGRMIKRWTTALGTGESRAARARVWALLQASFGLGDLVDAGELTVDEALGQFHALLRVAVMDGV
jgi:AcrR family transcriptional regulator